MNVLEKLYLIVKTVNIKDINEGKCFGISTNFIRKLTDLFFITVGEKINKYPIEKYLSLKKRCKTDISLWTHELTFV